MKICFLLPHAPNPRMIKRINLLKKSHDISLIYWNKKSVEFFQYEDEDINIIEIPIYSVYGKPLKRIFSTIKFMKCAVKSLKKIRPDIIYTTNIDLLFISYIYSLRHKFKVETIYEIADIHYLLIDKNRNKIKNLVGLSLKYIEKSLCKKIKYLVVTSDEYYNKYFSSFINEDKKIFIPNIPDISNFQGYRQKEGGKFTIGFIGAIRFEEQLKMLIDIAENLDFNVILAGLDVKGEITRYCADKTFVKMTGKYNYKNDIASLYGLCDCIFSVYDSDLNNVKMALPNKLYEAIYCELPIIVAKDTYLSTIVNDLGVGISVNCKDINSLKKALTDLYNDKAFYSKIRENCKIAKNDIITDRYNVNLLNIINNGDKCSKSTN